jgi:hypothetical protein
VVLMKIWSKARGAKARSLLTKFARVCGGFCSETSHSAAVHGLCIKSSAEGTTRSAQRKSQSSTSPQSSEQEIKAAASSRRHVSRSFKA